MHSTNSNEWSFGNSMHFTTRGPAEFQSIKICDDLRIVINAFWTQHRTHNQHFSGDNKFSFQTIPFTSLYHVRVSLNHELKKVSKKFRSQCPMPINVQGTCTEC